MTELATEEELVRSIRGHLPQLLRSDPSLGDYILSVIRDHFPIPDFLGNYPQSIEASVFGGPEDDRNRRQDPRQPTSDSNQPQRLAPVLPPPPG